MLYPNLFKDKYAPLKGKAWIKALPDEELKVFIDIGMQANDHGRMGGCALAEDREHMAKIGQRGAIMTNILRQWRKAVKEETEKELGIILDY